MELLDVVRMALALVMLGGAAALDLRSRRVPNAYWMPFAAAAAALLAVDAGGRSRADLQAFGLAFVVACGVALFAYGAWHLRLFGGADAKGIMVLAFLVPGLGGVLPLPFALDALMNGTLLAVAVPIALFAWNAAHGRLRLPAAFLGTPMPIAKAKALHVWPMQQVADDGRISWKVWGLVGMDVEEVYRRLESAGVAQVWVTAKIPFLTLVAAGAALALVQGNLLLQLAVRITS